MVSSAKSSRWRPGRRDGDEMHTVQMKAVALLYSHGAVPL
jgi:hypothetical protein